MIYIGKILKLLRAKYLTSKYIDEGSGKFKLSSPFVKFQINKKIGSEIILNGKLIVTQYYGGRATTVISLDKNAKLIIDGDFVLGDGVKIYLSENSELRLGGRSNEPISGITSNSMISVYKKVTIGKDFLCSWNVYITDCDWHSINNTIPFKEVVIGDHVWVGNNVNVLKGAIIGDNCIK